MRPNVSSRQRRALIVGAALVVLVSTGCARSVMLTTGTTVGLKISTNEAAQQRVKFGFNRTEAVYMPIRTCADNTTKAYSAYASIALSNSWPVFKQVGEAFQAVWETIDPNSEVGGFSDGFKLSQSFGTGKAARYLADPNYRPPVPAPGAPAPPAPPACQP